METVIDLVIVFLVSVNALAIFWLFYCMIKGGIQ